MKCNCIFPSLRWYCSNLILYRRSSSGNTANLRAGTPNNTTSSASLSSKSFSEADRNKRSLSLTSSTTSRSSTTKLPSRFQDLVLVCQDKETGKTKLHQLHMKL